MKIDISNIVCSKILCCGTFTNELRRKSMKKVIFSILTIFAIGLGGAHAESPIKLITAWGEGNMAHAILSNLSEFDNSTFSKDVEILGNCAAVANYLQNTNEPAVTILEAFYLNDEDPCNIKNEETFISLTGIAYWNFCRKPRDTDGIKEIQGNVRVGYFNGPIFRVPLESILSGLGSTGKAVPYNNAPAYKAALESGEVDYLFTTLDDPNMDCVLTTNPNSDIKHKVSDFYDGFFSEARYSLVILGANVDNEKIRNAFIESGDPAVSNLFVDGRGKNYDLGPVKKLSVEEQFDFTNLYVEKINKVLSQE